MKIERFKDLVSKDPNNELFRFSLAQAYIDDDQHQPAIDELDFCTRKKPDWMMAEILKAKSLLALQNKDAAKPVLERALSLAIEQNHEAPEAELRKLLASL